MLKLALRGRQVSGFRSHGGIFIWSYNFSNLIYDPRFYSFLIFQKRLHAISYRSHYLLFFLIPLCLKCGTFGIKFLSLQVVDSENSTTPLRSFFLRELIFYSHLLNFANDNLHHSWKPFLHFTMYEEFIFSSFA